jgi:hypothetical protein
MSDSSSATENRPMDAGALLKQDYQEFLRKAATLFPKVDQKLLMNMLYYENTYSDWEGNVLLKVVYPAGTDMDRKKEWIFQKYQRMGSIEQDKTLRFKAIRMYINDIGELLKEDPQIEFITGSATLTPSEAYTA